METCCASCKKILKTKTLVLEQLGNIDNAFNKMHYLW